MDLKQWVGADHQSVMTRFQNAVEQRVKQSYWKEGSETMPSIAWLTFHWTYHQDLALNTAIRNHQPLLTGHRSSLGLEDFAPAAGLSESENHHVTAALRLVELREYMTAVNSATRDWIEHLSVMALDSIPESSWRLTNKAGIPPDGDFSWLHEMWTGKPVSWFVQWECIGHGHNHVGEMIGIRNRLGLSPF